jgi:hypothetical protein
MSTRSIWILPAACVIALAVAACGRAPSNDSATGGASDRTESEIRAANEAAGAVGTLMPADESGNDPGFKAFHDALRAAVERRDTTALRAVIDPNIRVGFGGDDGIGGFRRKWLSADATEDLWRELGAVLALGGTFTNDSQFVAPWTFSRWPGELDAFEHVVVTTADVPLRAAPLPEGGVLASVSHAILRLHSNRELANSIDGWTVVERGATTPGFIESRHVRSPIHYRAFFERRAGEWRMTLMVAGD